MNKILILLTGIALTFACAAARPSAVRFAFEDDLQEAKKSINSGHLRQAIDDLTMLLAMDSKNDEARFLRATAYQELDDQTDAIQDYQTLLKRNPRFAKAHYNLGMIYAYKLNDPVRALEQFDLFLSTEPNHPKAFSVAKIMCSLDANRTETTDENFQQFLDQVMEVGDPEKRREKLLEGTRRYPSSPVTHYLIGKTYEYEGETEAAMRAYETALSLQSTCAPCHLALGKLLAKKSRNPEAELHLLKAKLFDPNDSQEVPVPSGGTEAPESAGSSGSGG